MRIKLDENLPARLVAALQNFGHDVDTVMDEGLVGKPDKDVWLAAQNEKRLLITQDLDFSDLRQFQPGTHSGLLLIRLREPGASALFNHILRAFRNNQVETWSGCFVVLTEHKLRVKHA